MMRSASPRRLSIINRSLRIPSTTRSAAASGWRRLVAANRFTRSPSEASRYRMRAGGPAALVPPASASPPGPSRARFDRGRCPAVARLGYAMEVVVDRLGHLRPDPGGLADLAHARAPQPSERAEPPQEGALAVRA